jgi:hypothetical protein
MGDVDHSAVVDRCETVADPFGAPTLITARTIIPS